MLKPFNAESAQLGDKVIAKRFQRSIEQARYLAKLEDGRHVVEFQAVGGTSFVEVVNEDALFAVPRKRTVYVNLYRRGAHHECAYHDTEDYAIQMTSGAEDWLIARAVPVEIEE
ncbi:hypothetical protein [Paraburkholderia sp. J11-2]|uniref:hypothetical protein n=1 Tax=Paraburkholderia sp. J11-2 TaxID=2805431 RepID=UPI002AB64DDF|nr:hypothetical protein [Paraburkholderia sp. J11-2]